MFASLLIANRGEIACRIIRTARAMGLRTIAVYSEADATALHVAQADIAVCIGPAAASASYLNIEAIIAAAQTTGAAAVHPGYGFLSENAAFAEACAAADLIFVGPPPAAIRAMGDKARAKDLMAAAGVPLVPGYQGEAPTPQMLAEQAALIGFPVLIKAAAGGGGRGMRRVERLRDLSAALASARREAQAAFGDDRVILEKYVEPARHIEVQVLADAHGSIVHLFERDCSLQRRHQKIVEEAPAPGLSDTQRQAMTAAAITAAGAVDYVGAGTVEFIVDAAGGFYFMEMNTRLQVEHPVTEMITGLDLVEWQLRIAAGERLPPAFEELSIDGHAVEVRLYAEDPTRDFLPAAGPLTHLRLPTTSQYVLTDTGVRAGDHVGLDYDPMLAKIIAWGEGRQAAIMRLRGALAEACVVGIATNLGFLANVVGHPSFAAAELDTGFVARHLADLLGPPAAAEAADFALAALAVLEARRQAAVATASRSRDPYSPWHGAAGWRLNAPADQIIELRDGAREVRVVARPVAGTGSWDLTLPDCSRRVAWVGEADGAAVVDLDGTRRRAFLGIDGDTVSVAQGPRVRHLTLIRPLTRYEAMAEPPGSLTAPMPGKVISVMVAKGDTIVRGQPLMVLEAMKMEHTIAAPADGRVESVAFDNGAQVEEGAVLLRLAGAE